MVYPDESMARSDIVKAGARLYQRGMVCANDGNISARISQNLIIVTPSGVSKGFMDEDSLVKLTLDGVVVDGEEEPSSEIKMHLAIYLRSSEVIAICHAHPPAASAFAAEGVALDKAYLQETAMLLGVIPLAPYALPGSAELAHGAAELSGDYNGALLEQHGAVTWGKDVMQALYRMESVEFAATVAMNMRTMGFNRTLNKSQIDDLIAMRAKWGINAGLGEF